MSAHTLVITLRSPFARRVRLAMRRGGVRYEEKIEDVFKPTPLLFEANPLALVPSLKIPSGTWIPDSAMILEYLDETQSEKIWPADSAARVAVRQGSVWAEGIMAATVQWFLESVRPDGQRSQEWMDEQRENIERTLSRIAESVGSLVWLVEGKPTQAGWDLGVALEYLSLRMSVLGWERRWPGLKGVLEACRASPDFRETAPPPA